MNKHGILLVNLGTPASPKPRDVFRYLNEFLTDRRVIDVPWFWRQLLVRLLIVPRRFLSSSKLYKRIWQPEGSPLLIHSQNVQTQLQIALGESYTVVLGMRYQNPSIQMAMDQLRQMPIEKLTVVPLFPQYASATTGSVHERVMECLARWQVIPETRFIQSYPRHSSLIEAFYQRGLACQPDRFDHILFSFHGLPEKHLRKADSRGCCLHSAHCCEDPQQAHAGCYRAQCIATAHALADKFVFTPDRYSVCFQSRLGKDPWTRPYTDEMIQKRAEHGDRKLLVFALSFTCDCLETLDEIGREYAHLFQQHGGIELQLVPSLNDHPIWIQGLKELIQNQASSG